MTLSTKIQSSWHINEVKSNLQDVLRRIRRSSKARSEKFRSPRAEVLHQQLYGFTNAIGNDHHFNWNDILCRILRM